MLFIVRKKKTGKPPPIVRFLVNIIHSGGVANNFCSLVNILSNCVPRFGLDDLLCITTPKFGHLNLNIHCVSMHDESKKKNQHALLYADNTVR